jgi:hypothetical protein
MVSRTHGSVQVGRTEIQRAAGVCLERVLLINTKVQARQAGERRILCSR